MCIGHFFILTLFCSVPSHESSILNRMLEYWQPDDVYVILNSTTAGKNGISAMSYPRFVSARGDFFSFIPQQPICSVFPDNFVLILFTDDNCQSVIPILWDQLSHGIIVKRSKVVIIVDTVAKKSIEGMFRDLWKIGLLNVFLLDESFIFGYNPFTNNFLIQYPALDFRRVISIDRAANFYGSKLRIPQIEVYPGAQNVIWHNRSMVIGEYFYVQQPFADYFNATLDVYVPEFHDFGFEFFLNDTLSVVHPGIGEELVVGRGDLTVMPRVYANSNFFDFLSPLYFRDCSLLIPKSGQITQYTLLASVTCSWVGLSSMINLILIVVFTAIMKRILQTEIEMTRFVLELGSVFIGQPFSFPIKTLSMRFTIISWLITCISLGTLFNAEIVTSFLTPRFIKELDYPFDALQGEGFKVYTFDDFVYYLRGNSRELFPSMNKFQMLLKKLRGVSRDEFFDRVLHPNGRDMFMVISMGDNLVEKTKYMTEQTYSYHKTKPFFISLTANIVPRGSIIYNHYNDFNYRIFEAGLLQHWKSLELLYEIKFGSGNEAQEKSLTIEDLYSAFLVLVLGYALAATVFAMEMFVAHFWIKFSNFSVRCKKRHLLAVNGVN